MGFWQEIHDRKNPAIQARDEKIASLVRSRDEARAMCVEQSCGMESLKHDIRAAIDELENGSPHVALRRLRDALTDADA